METIVYTVAFHGGTEVVVGPVADDNVYETIRLYESGVYTRDEALRRLKTERLFNQLTFKTAKALAYCKFVSSDLFDRHGVFDFIERCGDVLHCQSEANTIADIDDYIASVSSAR